MSRITAHLTQSHSSWILSRMTYLQILYTVCLYQGKNVIKNSSYFTYDMVELIIYYVSNNDSFERVGVWGTTPRIRKRWKLVTRLENLYVIEILFVLGFWTHLLRIVSCYNWKKEYIWFKIILNIPYIKTWSPFDLQ